MSSFIFVYGTLMEGFSNPFADRLARESERVGVGCVPGVLYKISWYPGLVYEANSSAKVYGEVRRLYQPELTIPVLDEYEEIDPDERKSSYLRRLVPVQVVGLGILDCWVYLYNQSVAGLEQIASGDFRTCRHITS